MFDIGAFSTLVSLEEARILTLDQCMYGGCTTKPTMLLFAMAASMTQFLGERCNHAPVEQRDPFTNEVYFAAHQRVIGVHDVAGNFATKGLAAYPMELNISLALAMATAIVGLPQRVLLLFSGPDTRADSLAVFLAELGITSLQVDIVNQGSFPNNVADDSHWSEILNRLRQGEFSFMFAAPPCETFSEARGFGEGPIKLRDRSYPEGFKGAMAEKKGLSAKDMQKVEVANTLATRTAQAAESMLALQRPWAIEQPKPWKHLVKQNASIHVELAKSVPSASEEPLPVDSPMAGPSLDEVWARLDSVVVTTKTRYMNVIVEGAAFSNGHSEMLGLNVSGHISKATRANGDLFANGSMLSPGQSRSRRRASKLT